MSDLLKARHGLSEACRQTLFGTNQRSVTEVHPAQRVAASPCSSNGFCCHKSVPFATDLRMMRLAKHCVALTELVRCHVFHVLAHRRRTRSNRAMAEVGRRF